MINEYESREDMIESRRAICEKCPLYLDVGGTYICNPNLYLNIEDGVTVSHEGKIGYRRGCGCLMTDFKYGNVNSKCVLGKW